MHLLLSLALLLAPPIYPNPDSESWIDGPEAYFITDAERAEWATLDTREEREAFKERYWLRRDPSPGTAANDFRDTILGRIHYADRTFGIEDTPGSRTARGFLFIVFGSPARASQDLLAGSGPGQPRSMVGMNEGTETVFRWTWDRERTPELMDALGRPKLELTVVLEPNRRRDRIQSPGLALELRDRLAALSITNPDLIGPAPAEPAFAPVPFLEPSGDPAWPQAVAAETANAAVVDSAVVFAADGTAHAVIWGFTDATGDATTPVAIRLEQEGQSGARLWSGTAAPTRRLIASRPGAIWVAVAEVPPGVWSGAIDTARTPPTPVHLEIPPAGELGISSLLIGGGPESGAPADPLFPIGPALLRPRADAQFTPAESLWYFLQFRGALPEETRLDARLMKRGEGIVTVWRPFAPDLVPAGEALQVAGYEVPLAGFAPGEYTLYVTIDAGGRKFLRRADFSIVAR